MAHDPTAGTFEELIAAAPANVQKIAKALRQMILAVHPDAVEVVRLGDRAASYGVGPKKMSEAHTYVMPLKDRVNLGFYYGALLDDPNGLMEGTGKKLRHIKVRTIDDASTEEVKALVQAALSERRATLGLNA